MQVVRAHRFLFSKKTQLYCSTVVPFLTTEFSSRNICNLILCINAATVDGPVNHKLVRGSVYRCSTLGCIASSPRWPNEKHPQSLRATACSVPRDTHPHRRISEPRHHRLFCHYYFCTTRNGLYGSKSLTNRTSVAMHNTNTTSLMREN